MDDIEEWLGLVEVEVANEDYGGDLASVGRLLKALQGLEEMVDAHMEKVQGLVDIAKDFSSQGNFLAENIQQRVWEVVKRYVFVQTPVFTEKQLILLWKKFRCHR